MAKTTINSARIKYESNRNGELNVSMCLTSSGIANSGAQPNLIPNVQYAATLASPAGMMTSDSKSGER